MKFDYIAFLYCGINYNIISFTKWKCFTLGIGRNVIKMECYNYGSAIELFMILVRYNCNTKIGIHTVLYNIALQHGSMSDFILYRLIAYVL